MNREQLAHEFKSKIICEIGVLRGVFANSLLKANPEELHLIDPWKKFDKSDYKNYSKSTQEDWNKRYAHVQKRFSGDKRVVIHRGTSKEMSSTFADHYFDLVYIDANHEYEYVKMDIELWKPKVKQGGYIAGHDIEIKGVKKAVEEAFGKQYNTTTEYNEFDYGKKFAKSWYTVITR